MENSNFTDILKSIDQSWTLFLDRDGVINEEVNKNYVKSLKEFQFYPHALDAIALFSKYFGNIVIATNQKGVALGLMTEDDLNEIHEYMNEEVSKHGGSLSIILACTSIHNDSFMRKPQAGMAYCAKKELDDEIDFSKSIMIGNSHSDLLFGRNAGMYTIFLNTTKSLEPHQEIDADWKADSLWSVAKVLESITKPV